MNGEVNADGAIGRDNVATWLASNADVAHEHLFAYFGGIPGVSFQGRYFEWFSQRSSPATFTSDDFMAISALSVAVRARTAHDILEDTSGAYRALLGECHALVAGLGPPVDLATCPEAWLADETSPFVRLYRRLRSEPDCGPVVTSKLMSAKFPRLVPIRDSQVEWILRPNGSTDWWLPMRNLFTAAKPTLEALNGSGVFDHVPALRRLDVVLWMEARRRLSGTNTDDAGTDASHA